MLFSPVKVSVVRVPRYYLVGILWMELNVEVSIRKLLILTQNL